MEMNNAAGTVQPEDPALVQRSEQELAGIYSGINYMDCIGAVRTLGYICESDFSQQVTERYLPAICSGIQQVLDRVADPGYFSAVLNEASRHPKLNLHESTRRFVAGVEEKFRQADANSRTYRGVVFSSAAEASAAASADHNMQQVMKSVVRSDPASIRAGIAAINSYGSPLGAQYLETLNAWLSESENRLRTFRGTIYSTVEERNAAEAEFRSYSDYVRSIDRNNEQAVAMAYNSFASCQYPTTQELKAGLVNILDAFDQQHRTVDGILFPTLEEAGQARGELQQISQFMPSVDPNNEPGLLEIRMRLEQMTTAVRDKYLSYVTGLLNSYDANMRTFRGVLYNTREEVAVLRSEDEQVRGIMASVRRDDEASMFAAREKLAELNTFLRDENLAVIDTMLKQYDMAMRTFEGVLYNTREEAALNRSESMQIDQVMAYVRPDDEQSILSAQAQINGLTTVFRDNAMERLDSMWQQLDQNARSYEGTLYESREHAENVRRTCEALRYKFQTTNVCDPAGLAEIDSYIAYQLDPAVREKAQTRMAAAREVINYVNYVYARDAQFAQAPDKNAAEELYVRARDIIPQMNMYGLNPSYMQSLADKYHGMLSPAQKLKLKIRK